VNYDTVTKCLFVTLQIEVDDRYLFIVHRFRLRIDFVYRLFLRNLSTFAEPR